MTVSVAKDLNCGVYAITHVDSGRRYIGSSISIEKRFREHKSTLKNSAHKNRFLQRAWDKHGAGKFSFDVLIYCSSDNVLFYEQLLIDNCKATDIEYGYNLRQKAESNIGLKRSPESIEKMKKAYAKAKAEGKITGHDRPHTEAAKQKIKNSIRKAREEGKVFGHNKPHSEEAKRKMSEALKGRPAWNKGTTCSQEMRKNISDAQRNSHLNPERAARRISRHVSHCRYGHPYSGDNLYISPKKKGRECKECRKMHIKNHRLKKKLSRGVQ